ncbi:hypothetical protein LTR85_004985 [Meristemomyces frigidus]|nr:hypothetical protein LTR85_004985 [Meristemomyces frigidus]
MGEKSRYFGFRGGWLTFWITVACGTDMTLFGYDQGVFGGVIVTDDFLQTLNIVGNTSLQGTITAIYDIGCFFGAIAAFVFGDYLGRKRGVLVGTTIMSVGAILQITSYSVAQMIIGRVIAGIGNGINTSIAPPWQAETSKASWRGKLIVVELILNIAGFSLSNWVTFGFSFVPGPVAWRLPLALQFIFIAILYATVPWLPESPRWLVAKGRIEEAEQILADVEGTDVDDPYVQTELHEIKFAANYEKEHAVRLRDLVRGKVGGSDPCAQAMQQLSGINVTSYYLPTVLIKSIMYAAAGQCFCYLIITVLLRFNEMPGYAGSKEVASASVAFFFLYYVFFGIGFQGVPWLYPTEINGLAMRQKGAALGTATNWIFNFMVVEITQIGIESLQWKFYIIWTVFNGAFVPFTYFLYPETASRTLEDIDLYFRGQPSLFVHRDKLATSSKRPEEFVAREETEVRRKSSVNERALGLAQRHRRFSLVEDHAGILAVEDRAGADKKTYEEKEHREKV